MPISHITIKKILRSEGCSAISTAAYCASQRLLDERLGLEFDYSYKKGVVYSEIFVPEEAPAWMKDRSKLWNTVEHIEKRRDAYLARELMVGLPSEFSTNQHIQLLKTFCQNQFVVKGMVADLNLYSSAVDNPYAYILLTTREIKGKGFGIKNTDWYKYEPASKYHNALVKLIPTLSKDTDLNHGHLSSQY